MKFTKTFATERKAVGVSASGRPDTIRFEANSARPNPRVKVASETGYPGGL